MSTLKDAYPSRKGNEEKIIKRPDPVVFGSEEGGEYSLNKEQLEGFDKNGFIILEDLFSEDEVNRLRSEAFRLRNDDDNLKHREFVTEPNSDVVRSIFDLPKFSSIFDELSRDRRFLDVAKQIVGDDVYLHQSRINIKPALDGKSFPWHSDFETWHVEDGLPAPRVVTGWIMLTENTPYNGPLFVIPGSHKEYVSCPGTTPKDNYKTSLRNQMLGTPSLKALKEFATKAEEEVIGVYGKAGTVVFHECNIMHGSPDNISPWPRTNCFFVYNSVNNKPINPPFGAKELRPEFLCNKNNSPLTTSN